jgi:glycosyltransferase involved in cell wall biosynthesis
MKIVIVDSETYKPYSLENLSAEGLGGTEATVVRIAEAMDAVVLQHNRTGNAGRYRPMDSRENPSHIVVVRYTLQAIRQAQLHPAARTFLWLHDLAGPDTPRGKTLGECASRLKTLRITLVCVSDFQAADIAKSFIDHLPADRPAITRIYNPVVVGNEAGSGSKFDRDKLVFFSSRQKGLDYTLYVFSYLHSRNRSLRLYLANPGYYAGQEDLIPGVVILGSLPHAQIVEHVRSSLCTFYPNYTYPETFGLVMAESNAVGTPVLAHAIGAASEVLRGEGQIMPVPRLRVLSDRALRRFPSMRRFGDAILRRIGALQCYEDRINAWRSGERPLVFARSEFSLDAIVAEWRHLFSSSSSSQ